MTTSLTIRDNSIEPADQLEQLVVERGHVVIGQIARERVGSGNVSFEVADVFSWTTSACFDVIFFSAWLSHVPTSRFEQFWELLRGLLTKRGRVLFIDEHVDEQPKETYAADAAEIVLRQLDDGSEYHIVKSADLSAKDDPLVRRLPPRTAGQRVRSR